MTLTSLPTRWGDAYLPGWQVLWGRARAVVLAGSPACVACLSPATQVDHRWPRALGGSDARRNLQPMCQRCNIVKGNRAQPGVEPVLCLPVDPGLQARADRAAAMSLMWWRWAGVGRVGWSANAYALDHAVRWGWLAQARRNAVETTRRDLLWALTDSERARLAHRLP